MFKFFLTIFLTGCAVGSGPIDPEVLNPPVEEAERVSAPEAPSAPTPVPQSCKLIRTVWGGNCRLDEYLCPDGSYRLDGKCYPGWELPHKNDPYPQW